MFPLVRKNADRAGNTRRVPFEKSNALAPLTCGKSMLRLPSRPELGITPVNIPGVASGTMIALFVSPAFD